jgi:hypothetical protein
MLSIRSGAVEWKNGSQSTQIGHEKKNANTCGAETVFFRRYRSKITVSAPQVFPL